MAYPWAFRQSLTLFRQENMNIAQLRITENLQQRIFTRSALEFATRIPKIQLRELLLRYAPEWTNRFFDTLTIQKGISKLLIDFTAASLQIWPHFTLILPSIFYHFWLRPPLATYFYF